MNRGNGQAQTRSGGYTIVETLIFLAVSALIFFSAMQLIGGQQNKTQFITAVRDFETKLTDIANDVSTGYYQGDTSFPCSNAGGGVLSFAGTADGQGSKKDCIFVGTVVKLGGAANNDDERAKFTQLTMAGLRIDSATGQNVATLSAAKPQVVQVPSTYAQGVLEYGATIRCVGTGTGCTYTDTDKGAIGFFTKFVGTSPSGGNGIQTDVVFYNNGGAQVSLVSDPASQISSINNSVYYTVPNPSLNPANGVTICIQSSGTKQYALIHIGGNGNQLTFSNEIKGYSGPNPSCL